MWIWDCSRWRYQFRRVYHRVCWGRWCDYLVAYIYILDYFLLSNSCVFLNPLLTVVIDNEICVQRLRKLKHKVETNFYLCQINNNLLVDATYKGNKSRYFNHSCDPNTVMQKWFVNLLLSLSIFSVFLLIKVTCYDIFVSIRMIDGETRLGIFATRDINKGEHLTYDYQ